MSETVDAVHEVNTVHLVGRVSAAPQTRELPSGNLLLQFRVVEVDGSLRRRFFATGAGRVSRYEVEADRVRRRRTSV